MNQRNSSTHRLTRVALIHSTYATKKGVEALASTPRQSPRHEDSILSVTHRGNRLRNRSEMPARSTADTCNDHPSASCNPLACLNSASDCSGRGVDLLDQPLDLRYNLRSMQSVATRMSHLDFRSRPSYARDGCCNHSGCSSHFGCYSHDLRASYQTDRTNHSGCCSRDSHDSYHTDRTNHPGETAAGAGARADAGVHALARTAVVFDIDPDSRDIVPGPSCSISA